MLEEVKADQVCPVGDWGRGGAGVSTFNLLNQSCYSKHCSSLVHCSGSSTCIQTEGGYERDEDCTTGCTVSVFQTCTVDSTSKRVALLSMNDGSGFIRIAHDCHVRRIRIAQFHVDCSCGYIGSGCCIGDHFRLACVDRTHGRDQAVMIIQRRERGSHQSRPPDRYGVTVCRCGRS